MEMPDKEEPKPVCGIVMPISELDGCSEEHWSDVHEIILEAIDDAGFEANLVSNADDVGIIQKRIIQNLYDNPIVVCDVSGKNPNVMFELGLRLAFDKPTIIVKDDKTSYSFDTAPIEHIEYPRDLRFSKIVEFKSKLSDKIRKTYEKSSTDANYTTFLKHFGEFKVAKIDKKEVSSQEFILDELKGLRAAIARLDRGNGAKGRSSQVQDPRTLDVCVRHAKEGDIARILERTANQAVVTDFDLVERSPNHKHLKLFVPKLADRQKIRALVRTEFPHVGIQGKKVVRRQPKQ